MTGIIIFNGNIVKDIDEVVNQIKSATMPNPVMGKIEIRRMIKEAREARRIS